MRDTIHEILGRIVRVSAMIYVVFAILGAVLCTHVLTEIQKAENIKTQETIEKAKEHFGD